MDETYETENDDFLCPHCGGEGSIMACDGDGSDWGEDTYSGPMDEVIECRHCNGTGTLLAAAKETPAVESGEGS